jgi:L-ascorbate metabolism protein UlaG (beta-lactamase superfamily)
MEYPMLKKNATLTMMLLVTTLISCSAAHNNISIASMTVTTPGQGMEMQSTDTLVATTATPGESNHLRLDFIPEQIAFRGEPFLPFNLQGFLLYDDEPARDKPLTWTVTSSAHLSATVEKGVLNVTLTFPDWYGSENLDISGCDENINCVHQNVVFSRIDENSSNYVRVVFVGNSGFLITAGDKKVLIDALFDGIPPEYMVPQFVLDTINASTPPFDNVDVVLASHSHADHFSSARVRAYMENNPHSVFLSTTQCTSQLEELGNRVIAMDPVKGKPVTMEVNGVTIEAVYISHGEPPVGQQEVYNNGYIISMNGIRIFFSGDVDNINDAIAYGLADMGIDLAFIQHFFLRYAQLKSSILNGIGAKYYFPIHYELTDPPFSASTVRDVFPDAVIFNSELQSWIMPQR